MNSSLSTNRSFLRAMTRRDLLRTMGTGFGVAGLASTLNEIAAASNVGIEIDEPSLPVRAEVQSACELLGLDPVYVANEGKAVFFVTPQAAQRALEVIRAHPLGRDAARIGRVTAQHPGMLVARTAMGANRVIATQIGEQLPRIC